MNLTIDLKSITDVDSDRSSNDIESYDSVEGYKKQVEMNGVEEKEGEAEGNEDEKYQEEEEDEEDVDEEEDEYELRENLDSWRSYGSGKYDMYSCSRLDGYLYDYDRYWSSTYSGKVDYGCEEKEKEDEDEEKYCLFKECEFRMRRSSRQGRRRNEDLVCFYVNAVTNSNDLIKYFRPRCRVPESNDSCLCNYQLSVSESLEKLTLKEDKEKDKSSATICCQTKSEPFERELCPIPLMNSLAGKNTCRSVSFTSNRNWCCDDNCFRSYSYRNKPLVNSNRSPFFFGKESSPFALDLCGCSSTSGRRVSPHSHRMDGYAASLASAARSARNLARDLDHLLTTLSSEDVA